MTVYADTLFITNGLVDYLLLLLAGRVMGAQLNRWRLLVGGAAGGLYAVACFLPFGGALARWPVKLAVGVLLVLIAYGGHRRLLRLTLIFFGLACGLGGGVYAIALWGGGLSLERGVLLTAPDLKAVLLAAAVCWCGLSLAFRGIARHSRLTGEVIPLEITLGHRRIRVSALVDTGNSLHDPTDGSPAVLLEWQEALPLLPELTAEDVSAPATGMARLGARGRFRLLPYRAVGVSEGLLLAFRADKITSAGKNRTETLVALTEQPVSRGGGYTALAGTDGK